MIEDGAGSLFLLTSNGIFQFDLNQEQYHLLPIESPSCIARGKNGIWVSTQESLIFYNKHSKEIYIKPLNNDLNKNNFTHLVEDNYGYLWGALEEGGLVRFDLAFNAQKYLDNIRIMKLFLDSDNRLWVGTENDGIFCISPNGDILKHYEPHFATSYVRKDMARAICQDLDGNIWLGYRSGLSKIDISTNKVYHYQAKPNGIGVLSNSSVTSLFTDRQGTIWIGTYWGGVNYFSPEYQNYTYYNTTNSNLPFPIIGAITEGKDNEIWICTEGGGINLYNAKDTSFKSFNRNTNTKFSSDFLKDIAYDKSKNCLWVAADFSNKINCFHLDKLNNEIIDLTNKKEIDIGNGLFALANSPNILYIGAKSAVLSLEKQNLKTEIIFSQKELFTHNSNSLLLDSQKRLWFAIDKGLVAYSIKDKKSRIFKMKLEKKVESQKELINTIYEDHAGNILVGTHGYGLFLLDEKSSLFKLYAPANKFSGPNIRTIVDSPSGNWLIGTGHGLSKLDKKTGKVINFTSTTGFPLTLVNRKSLYVSRDKDIYIGGANGLLLIKEEGLCHHLKKFDLQFSRLYINNKEITTCDKTDILKQAFAYTDKIELKYNQNTFSISLATDNYLNFDNDIAYRLVGYNGHWNKMRFQKDITYTNIPPGTYYLEIISSSNPTNIKKLEICINPPYYATWWAYVIYIILIVVSLFFIIREYRMRLFLKASLDFEHKEKKYIEESNQSKLRFFTNISHEIRTPITLILAQLDILLYSNKLPANIYSKLLSIHKSTENLKMLITELLDFRKQEQGCFQLRISFFDLYQLLNEHYTLFKDLATSRNINFSINRVEECCMIWADRIQLQKAINNLLSNAFKFTADNGIIEINLSITSENYIISIKDNGIGIAENEFTKIFERFYQSNHSDYYEGTGIGLSLTKGIIDAHHGTISVESKENEGTRFYVTLLKGDTHFDSSIIRVNEEQAHRTLHDNSIQLTDDIQLATNDIISTNSKLLIVDDNEEIRNTLIEVLSPLYTINTANDGQQGYEKVMSMQPDLVITDIMMPRMSGTELCRKIKNNIETCHIPVILLTALSTTENEIDGLRTGADYYIAKPFNIKKLVMSCNNLINTRQILQKKYAHQIDAKIENIATNSLDKKFIEQATAVIEKNIENAEFNVELFSREMAVGRTVLFQKIKGITGITPNNFIMNIRLKKSAYYLTNSPEMNITEISDRLCFGNPQYFNKCFKELFGISPTQYRKSGKNAQ